MEKFFFAFGVIMIVLSIALSGAVLVALDRPEDAWDACTGPGLTEPRTQMWWPLDTTEEKLVLLDLCAISPEEIAGVSLQTPDWVACHEQAGDAAFPLVWLCRPDPANHVARGAIIAQISLKSGKTVHTAPYIVEVYRPTPEATPERSLYLDPAPGWPQAPVVEPRGPAPTPLAIVIMAPGMPTPTIAP